MYAHVKQFVVLLSRNKTNKPHSTAYWKAVLTLICSLGNGRGGNLISNMQVEDREYDKRCWSAVGK